MLGTLVLTSCHRIDGSTRSTAVAAVEHISMAIANLRLQETLRHQSLRDPLTGLFNRRYLEASLERELSLAKRNHQPLAVLMLDIDHFKRFNDEHGHDGGDALLTQFGAMLAGMMRAEDVACRYGGEEFTVLLQDANLALALRRAEAICAAVRELKVSHQRQSLGSIRVSIGVACFPKQAGDVAELLRQADRALYVAKRNGRDQVCVAQSA
ncbi:MAG: GGDEF domain-containing protein [Dokdonella sp.]